MVLRTRGRVAEIIDARSYWRDASLRFEFGHEDADTFALWLDATAMRREVLDPLGPDGHGAYLPSLRDPGSNRATRAPARRVPSGAIVIISGELLLAHGLPFDVTIHLAMSPAAPAPSEQLVECGVEQLAHFRGAGLAAGCEALGQTGESGNIGEHTRAGDRAMNTMRFLGQPISDEAWDVGSERITAARVSGDRLLRHALSVSLACRPG